MSDLLFEIGTEEIPAGYIEPALQQLQSEVQSALTEARLEADAAGAVGSPRRLTVWATGVPDGQPPLTEEVVGPPAGVAYDEEGNPTKAAEGFARSQDVAVEDLSTKETDKGLYVAAVVEHEGEKARDVLPNILRDAALNLRFPKSMRWPVLSGGNLMDSAARFARPIRSIVAMFDDDIIEVKLASISADNVTHGHPFLSPGPVELPDASFTRYRTILADNYVIVDQVERRERVVRQVDEILSEHGSTRKPAGLVDEVTHLVEYPHAIEGTFDEEFLAVPDCVLCAAMIKHQRYFPVWDADGNLLNKFVIVSNRTPQQAETVREGNERVLRARLDDGRFFWEEDREVPLEDLVEQLEGVVFLGGLGNNLQRTQRLETLSANVGHIMGLGEDNRHHLVRAAHLCKADLLTGLVGEFPDLQGDVGRELAREEGLSETVAVAIAEHYLPEGTDDEIPQTPPGIALALSDKLDIIAGCFSLGYEPTGSQDPYALRRNALGILMILEKHELDVHLNDLIQAAAHVLENQSGELGGQQIEVPVAKVLDFCRDRLYHAAIDQDHPHDFVRATLSTGFDHIVPPEPVNYNVHLFWKRLHALEQCAGQDWWATLVELVDRTYRIQKDVGNRPDIQPELFEDPEEKELAHRLAECRDDVAEQFEAGRFVGGTQLYCETLAGPVHAFFEEVFVNVDNDAMRRNRKALCGQVYHLFADYFADLYLIEDAGSSSSQ
ncbi:MAG: glycine--tRNA ligase subunit beta [Planctomycetota bacterium]